MPVSVIIPRVLAPYAKGSGRIVLTERCATVGAALFLVAREWPALSDRILDEQGAVRRHVNVFVGEESIRFLDGLGTTVGDNDTITIVPAVSGG